MIAQIIKRRRADLLKNYINVEYIIANELKTEKRRKIFLLILDSKKDSRNKEIRDRMKDIFEGNISVEKFTAK